MVYSCVNGVKSSTGMIQFWPAYIITALVVTSPGTSIAQVRIALPWWVKFKAWQHVQWAICTHNKGPSRIKTELPEGTDQSEFFTQIEIQFSLSLFFISNRFKRTQNNFGHQPCPALASCGDLPRYSRYRQTIDLACYLPYHIPSNQIPGLSKINVWWKRQIKYCGLLQVPFCLPRDFFYC